MTDLELYYLDLGIALAGVICGVLLFAAMMSWENSTAEVNSPTQSLIAVIFAFFSCSIAGVVLLLTEWGIFFLGFGVLTGFTFVGMIYAFVKGPQE